MPQGASCDCRWRTEAFADAMVRGLPQLRDPLVCGQRQRPGYVRQPGGNIRRPNGVQRIRFGRQATLGRIGLEYGMTNVIQSFVMRYSPTHKHATRRRILEVASQAFRERGVAETGVDEVMRRAGLTHGGFYAHFADKTELVAEACAVGFAEAVPNLERIAAQPAAAARMRLLIDSYLASRHRDNRGSGCLIVAVAADIARSQGPARTGYARAFTRHLDRLADALRLSADPVENHERVIQLMSSLVGALLFARALEDPAQSERVLHSMRRRLKAEFCREPMPDKSPTIASAEQVCPSHDLLRAF